MRKQKQSNTDNHDSRTLTGRSMIVPILFCLVCGVLLILFGSLAVRITAYVLAGVMLLYGIWSIIVYIKSKPFRRIAEARLATGLILLVAGTLLAFSPDYLENSMVYIWGLALLFGGFLKIQYAFDEKTVGVNKWWLMLILAAFSLIVGILSLLNPAFLGESRNLVIGIVLVLEAVLDIAVFFLLKHSLKKLGETAASAPVPASDPVSAPVSQDAIPEGPVPSAPEPEPSVPEPTVPETEA